MKYVFAVALLIAISGAIVCGAEGNWTATVWALACGLWVVVSFILWRIINGVEM